MTEQEIKKLVERITEAVTDGMREEFTGDLYIHIDEQFEILSEEIRKEIQNQFYDLKKALDAKN